MPSAVLGPEEHHGALAGIAGLRCALDGNEPQDRRETPAARVVNRAVDDLSLAHELLRPLRLIVGAVGRAAGQQNGEVVEIQQAIVEGVEAGLALVHLCQRGTAAITTAARTA